jgi:hypothetical protein
MTSWIVKQALDMHVGKERTAGALYRHTRIQYCACRLTQNFGRVPVKFVSVCSARHHSTFYFIPSIPNARWIIQS